MKTNKTCLVFALLSAFGATVQAGQRPEWEQALALAPMVDGVLGLPGLGLVAVTVPELAPTDLPLVAHTLPDFGMPDSALPDSALPDLSATDGEGLARAGATAPEGWQAVDSSELDDMRGGFSLGGGLIVSLGLERLVSINGELVARTSFELPAVAGIAGGAADAAREAFNSGGLIQNGPGNIAPVLLSPDALGATVIQNTLNDQTIRSQTIINASVNSATLMQSLNFNDSVGQAIRDAVRPN